MHNFQGGDQGAELFNDWGEEGHDDNGDRENANAPSNAPEPEARSSFADSLPQNLEYTEADLPIFEKFAHHMHEAGFGDTAIHEALHWYANFSEQIDMNADDADLSTSLDVQEALRDEWGSDYDSRVDAIAELIKTAPDAERLNGARLANGTLVFNDPEILRWLGAALFGELFEDAAEETDTRAGTRGGMGLEAERQEIERVMRQEPQKYWRDASMQDRYREILERLHPPEE